MYSAIPHNRSFSYSLWTRTFPERTKVKYRQRDYRHFYSNALSDELENVCRNVSVVNFSCSDFGSAFDNFVKQIRETVQVFQELV